MSPGPSIKYDGRPPRRGHLGQPAAVGAVPAAHDQDHVRPPRQRADRLLPVLRGIANVVFQRRGDLGKSLAQPLDRAGGIVTESVVCVR